MSKFELSLARDYVPDWTLTDAIRELFQNALDQEVQAPGNDMFYDWDDRKQIFKIGNKKSVLDTSSLLLGSSTKLDDEGTIGQFGEGYKIATLVLTRLGKNVVFYNYGRKEVWRPRFVKSRKYGAEILTFFVDKKHVWDRIPDNDLTIEIHGITEDDYYAIADTNLHMQEAYEHFKTPNGDILLDYDMRGKMFVNGLYITTNERYVYGYNFAPKFIQLDRDRKLITDFNTSWATSQLWLAIDEDDTEGPLIVSDMLENDAPDVKYIKHQIKHRTAYTAVATSAYKRFVDKYGTNAVPVASQEEAENITGKHKAIFVPEEYRDAVVASPEYEEPELEPKRTLHLAVKDWLESWKYDMDPDAVDTLNQILEEFDE